MQLDEVALVQVHHLCRFASAALGVRAGDLLDPQRVRLVASIVSLVDSLVILPLPTWIQHEKLIMIIYFPWFLPNRRSR